MKTQRIRTVAEAPYDGRDYSALAVAGWNAQEALLSTWTSGEEPQECVTPRTSGWSDSQLQDKHFNVDLPAAVAANPED